MATFLSYEYLRSIQQTLDGGYVFTGNTGSNDGDVTGNQGSYDLWVVKINPVGEIHLNPRVLIYPHCNLVYTL